MLTENEKKTLQHYEEDLAMPKWKYIFVYGIAFSALMAVFTFVTDFLLKDISFSEFGWHLLIRVSVATFLYGMFLRWLTRRDYRKLKRKELLPE